MYCCNLNGQNSETLSFTGSDVISRPCEIYGYTLTASNLTHNTIYTIYLYDRLETQFVDLTGWTYTTSLPNSGGVGYVKVFNSGNSNSINFSLKFKMEKYWSDDFSAVVVGSNKGISLVALLEKSNNIVDDWSQSEKVLTWTNDFLFVVPAGYTVTQAYNAGILTADDIDLQKKTYKYLYLEGDFIIDVPFYFGKSYYHSLKRRSIIFVEKGAKILVNAGKTLYMEGAAAVSACNDGVWKGIEVENNARLIVIDKTLDGTQYKSKIKESKTAVFTKGDAFIYIENSDFEDNYVGFDMNKSNSSNNVNLSVKNCTFRGLNVLLPNTLPDLPNEIYDPSQPYCGIILRNNSNITSPTEMFNNRFDHLENGIIALNSEMDFATNKFSNIVDTYPDIDIDDVDIKGTAIHFQGKGITKLKYEGTNLIAYPDMTNCDFGVVVDKADAELIKIVMTSINKSGLVVKNGQMNKVSCTNGQLYTKQNAVSLFNNSYGDISIKENILNVTDGTVAGSVGLAIVNNTFLLGNYSPHAIQIESNTITAVGKAKGIYSINNAFTGINNNIIHTADQTEGDGVILENDFGTVMSCNQFVQNGSTASNKASAIFNKVAPFSFIQCNELNDFPTGMEFFGPNLDDNIKGNEFKNHGNTGLLYDHEAVTGEQKWNGNVWNYNYYPKYGATHTSGDKFLVEQSQYRVDPGNYTNHTTLIYTQSPDFDWFVNNSQVSSFTCSPSSSCSFGAPQIFGVVPTRDSLNLAISNDSLNSEVYPGSYSWIAKRQLYTSFLHWPSSLQEHDDYQSFYNNQTNETVGKFANFDYELKFGAKPDSTQFANIASYRNSYNAANILIDSLESESTPNQTAINQAYNQLSNIKSGAAQIFQNIASNWSTIVNQQDTANQAIYTQYDYEANQKFANSLWLKSLLNGIQSISDSQMTLLENLAYQCPLEGGQGVITARAILIQLGNYSFDDRVLCQPVENRENKNPTNIREIGFYPNPASSEITLALPSDLDCQRLKIVNIVGQVISIFETPKSGQSIKIDSLANGMYILVFDFKDSASQSLKLFKN